MLTRRHLLNAAPAAALARPALAQGKDKLLKFVPAAAYSSPDPIWTTAIVVGIHALMVWDTPYGSDINLMPKPQMCAGEEVSADGLNWVFTLREGLLFHDGEKVRAHDVVPSINRWGQRNTYGQRLLAIANEIAVVDDRRWRIRLKEPFPQMLYALSQGCYVMPERMAKVSASQPIKEFVGSGPFVFQAADWVSGVRSVYTKFDKYLPRQEAPSNTAGGKVVNFDRVEWVIQPDPGTGASALMAGEVDWVDQPLFDHLPMLQRNQQVRVEAADPFGLIGGLFMNQLHPPFNNVKMRQAVMAMVDQREFIAAVLGDQARFAKIPVGYFTVGSPFASEVGMEALTGKRDLEKARQLVKESGYAGEPVLLMSPSDQPQMHAMAAMCDSIFKQLGINVQLTSTDWGTLLTRRSVKKAPGEGGWNTFNTRITGLGGADPTSVQLRANGEKAWFGWPDVPEIERLREAWFKSPTLAAQQAICRDIQKVAFERVPYIPLGQWSQPTAHRSDLTGFVPSSTHVFWGVKRG